MRPLRGIMNGYALDESEEFMRGGRKCPCCSSPMSRRGRLCASCMPGFKNWLRKVYGRDVKTLRPRVPTGGKVAAAKRRRLQTLKVLRDNGPTPTPELGRLVGMTAEGVREQLKRLGADGLVDCVKEGRVHIWTANGS